MKTEDIIKANDYSIFEDLLCNKIDMYYSGWECDSVAWIFHDGRIFGTNHGTVCEISRDQFEVYKNELKLYIKEVEFLLPEEYTKYEITMISKDGNLYTMKTSELSEIDAVEKCTMKLIEKGWFHQYDYKFQSAKIIKEK